MSRFLKAILVLTIGLLVFSCNRDDDSNGVKPEPYDEQHTKDSIKIVTFLKEYHMDVDTDFEVTFTKITPENNLQPMWGDARLEHGDYEIDEVPHRYYFWKFRQGTETAPIKGDSILVSYRGEYLYTKKEEILPSTNPKTYKEYIAGEQFDQAQNPVWFSLDLVVDGWKEILPKFNSGPTPTFDPATGVLTYDNYGAGVFFIPSALGYYSASGTIPSYSPMVFSVKLMRVNRVDHDFDGIDSYDEDLNHDGKFKVVEGIDDNTIDDDSDDDGKADYRDQDDDGDGVLTKDERPGRVSIDTDGDGKPNYLDTDDDGDGIATAAEILRGDTDNDGTKNYLDTDDDGDGILTINEGTGDCNNNGVPNYLDPVVCP